MNPNIIAFAISAHDSVNHKYAGHPYSVHLAMVASFAHKYTVQQHLIDACWLHDVIEDCRLTYNDVVKVAGSQVADIVYAVTNEKGRTRAQRANDKYYEGIRNNPGAIFVKLCDRLANVSYSKQEGSSMYVRYEAENDHFIKSLFPNEAAEREFSDMVGELTEIFSS